MPWRESTAMSQRIEFIQLATRPGANVSQLCGQFGISRKTGYKWLNRFRAGGHEALADQSRRPHHMPNRTPPAMEARIVQVREEHPAWGGPKIHAFLRRAGEPVPNSPNTVTAVLHRHGLIDPSEKPKHTPYQRFEREKPNQLWQMDFKGYFALADGSECHPLTVLDDHSRFLLGLKACPNEQRQTVQAQLGTVFRAYGLPERMIMDNGSPWGDSAESRYTIFTTWLMRLGIKISHSRPYHPQTMGKDERLHRTLKAELLSRRRLADLPDSQAAFDAWREMYNHERPHQALDMEPPSSRYESSPRPFPEELPPLLYEPGDHTRKVDAAGRISFANRPLYLGKAFRGQLVGVRPTDIDGVFSVYFCSQCIKELDLRQ
jgi:transposase InsO family protein